MILLSGCSGVGELIQMNASGQSTYRYEKTNEGCKVWVTSARKVGAASLSIDKNCAVQGVGKALNGSEAQLKLLDLLDKQVKFNKEIVK